MESIPKYSSSSDRDQPSSSVTASTGRRPDAVAGTHGQWSVHLERHHESTYHCSRAGRAVCQPDLRSDRQQSDLWRLRLGTELPLLRFQSITPLGEDFRFKPTRWLDDAAGPVPAASSKFVRCTDYERGNGGMESDQLEYARLKPQHQLHLPLYD